MTVPIGTNTPIFSTNPTSAEEEKTWWEKSRTWSHLGAIIASIAKHHL
jgi:hypothetical protein